VTSGIRIGTPAVTTRGMEEKEMEKIAEFIFEALKHAENDEKLAELKKEVHAFSDKFSENGSVEDFSK